MSKTTMEKTESYILEVILILLGLVAIIGSLTIAYLDSIGTWTPGVTKDLASALMAPRDDQPVSLGIGLRLSHYLIGGLVLSGIGASSLTLKRRIVPPIGEITITLKCPLCQFSWQESMTKTTLEHIGYPDVKRLASQRCAKCEKFMRPRIAEVKGLEQEKK